MAYNRPTKDSGSIGLGRCDIYISEDYAANLGSTDMVLPDDAYVGNSLTTEVLYSRISQKIYEIDKDAPVGTLHRALDVSISMELNEISKENLSLLWAGIFDNTVSEISIGSATEKYFRMELRYLYPNKKRAIIFVAAKVSLDDSDRLRFINDNNTRPNIVFGTHNVTDENAAWASYPAGLRAYFIDL